MGINWDQFLGQRILALLFAIYSGHLFFFSIAVHQIISLVSQSLISLKITLRISSHENGCCMEINSCLH